MGKIKQSCRRDDEQARKQYRISRCENSTMTWRHSNLQMEEVDIKR
jgi:hypothetical protein